METNNGVYVKVGMRVVRNLDGAAYTVAPKAPGWKMLRIYHDNGDKGMALFSEYTRDGNPILGYAEGAEE